MNVSCTGDHVPDILHSSHNANSSIVDQDTNSTVQLLARFDHVLYSLVGPLISSGNQVPPSSSICFTKSGSLEGFREVAMILWPFLRAVKERDVPKPEEQPVMSQTRGLQGEDILNASVDNGNESGIIH